MKEFRTPDWPVRDVPRSGYDYVGGQIAALITRFDLHSSRSVIMQTYEDICRDSLAFPYGTRPPNHSRINHDGTPIQYAVTLGPSPHTLQFLSEAGSPGTVGAERLQVNRDCITAVAQRLHIHDTLASLTHLLDTLVPDTNVDLLTDPGGAYWVGVAFSAAREPHMKIYINTRWGQERGRWTRLSQFAAHFGQSAQWEEAASRLASDLQPLGTAITLHANHPPAGRIYLSTYGKHMSFYEELAGIYGGASFMRQLHTFGRCVLASDYGYPMQTAVCSFGLSEHSWTDFKLELCAHCLFASDVEAVSRLHTWFEVAHLDATDYGDILDVLSEGHLSDTTPDLHCYVGVGLHHGAPYTTVYFKPRLIGT